MRYRNLTQSVKAVAFASLIIAAGCQSDEHILSPKRPVVADNPVDWSEIIGQYDTTNLVGVVQLTNNNEDVLFENGNAQLQAYQMVYSNADASFSDGHGGAVDVADITVNAVSLHRAGPGSYYTRNNDNLVLSLGTGSNAARIVGLPGSIYGNFQGQLSYGIPGLITNIERGDTISRDSILSLNWTGNGSGYVAVHLDNWTLDSEYIYTPDTAGTSFSWLYQNTGHANIQLYPFQFHKGYANLTLVQYEPDFVTLSSGKRICFLMAAKHEITVYIKD